MGVYFNNTMEEQTMKVFISWSGTLSKKVALVFRDWLPSVIQTVETFVSSEDIEKGARWNTDIAKELKESSFGIICVTKDNLNAPWLNFEAGALSKIIDNTYVAPFLFDIKPSELTGSPISQFQATSFTKDDVKRLVETLNNATGNILPAQRLDNTFNVWYESLESDLNDLLSDTSDIADKEVPEKPDILEEILETSRNTQRLLGNTDTKLYSNLEQLQKRTDELMARYDKQSEFESRRVPRRFKPIYVDEILYMAQKYMDNNKEASNLPFYFMLIVLSPVKHDFPWFYDAGKELVNILKSNVSINKKHKATYEFKQLLELISNGHPVFKDAFGLQKESYMTARELCKLLEHFIDEFSKYYIITSE